MATDGRQNRNFGTESTAAAAFSEVMGSYNQNFNRFEFYQYGVITHINEYYKYITYDRRLFYM